jgi:C-terminal processing protease CtpA/Prc
MRKASLIVSAFAAIAVSGAAGSTWLPVADTDRPLGLMDEALTIVHNEYVDEVPWAKLVRDGIAGMVEALDADGALLGPPQSRALWTTAHPDNGDVGIVLGRRTGGLAVIAARDGTPARQAGLQSGDFVLSIDGVSTQRMLPDRGRGAPAWSTWHGRHGQRRPDGLGGAQAPLPEAGGATGGQCERSGPRRGDPLRPHP